MKRVLRVVVINIHPDRREIERGRVLHEWTNLSSMPGSNESAVLVPTTDGKNSDTFIALSYNHPDPLDTENLHIVSMSDPEQIIWKGPGTTPIEKYPDYVERDIHPETNLPNKRSEFFLRTLTAADIFPEIPGKELVSIVTNRKQFPTAIRIHSLAPLLTCNEPKLLYEVWHPGYLYQIHWHDETSQLIAAGVNNRFDYASIGEPHNPWGQAVVAFATKPVLNHIEGERETKRWLTQYNKSEVGGPTWYSTLSPSSYSEKWIIASIERLNSRDNDGKILPLNFGTNSPLKATSGSECPGNLIRKTEAQTSVRSQTLQILRCPKPRITTGNSKPSLCQPIPKSNPRNKSFLNRIFLADPRYPFGGGRIPRGSIGVHPGAGGLASQRPEG